MKMKWLWTALLTLLAFNLFAGDVKWGEDFNTALKQAKEQDKLVLLNFSGSDWCFWCKKLNNEVFSQEDFLNYAKDNLVLMVADFPKAKQQSKALKTQNEKLMREFGVRGFPTIFLIDADGKIVATTGYREGGAAKYVNHLESLKEGKFK